MLLKFLIEFQASCCCFHLMFHIKKIYATEFLIISCTFREGKIRASFMSRAFSLHNMRHGTWILMIQIMYFDSQNTISGEQRGFNKTTSIRGAMRWSFTLFIGILPPHSENLTHQNDGPHLTYSCLLLSNFYYYEARDKTHNARNLKRFSSSSCCSSCLDSTHFLTYINSWCTRILKEIESWNLLE